MVSDGAAEPHALVTGASSGIGEATCHRLRQDGWRVVGLARRPSPAACVSVQTDIASFDHLVNALRPFPSLGLVVHCAAGVDPVEPLCESDPNEWRQAVDVNLIGTYNVLRAVLSGPLREGGVAIHLTTGAAHRARPHWSAYAASKAGAEHLVRIAAAELAHTDRAVCALDPGITETAMQRRIRRLDFPDRERFVRAYQEQTSRAPEEVAEAVSDLAARSPRDLNGKIFRVGSL